MFLDVPKMPIGFFPVFWYRCTFPTCRLRLLFELVLSGSGTPKGYAFSSGLDELEEVGYVSWRSTKTIPSKHCSFLSFCQNWASTPFKKILPFPNLSFMFYFPDTCQIFHLSLLIELSPIFLCTGGEWILQLKSSCLVFVKGLFFLLPFFCRNC